MEEALGEDMGDIGSPPFLVFVVGEKMFIYGEESAL